MFVRILPAGVQGEGLAESEIGDGRSSKRGIAVENHDVDRQLFH